MISKKEKLRIIEKLGSLKVSESDKNNLDDLIDWLKDL